MRLLLCTTFVFIAVGVASAQQSAPCPPDRVCLTQAQAAKYLTLEDTVKAQEKEILALKQAVIDQKLVTMDVKIELAKTVGEKTQMEKQIVDLRDEIKFLLTNGRKKCGVFSLCIQ